MDGLRWLLLFFGLLVIAGVYFYSRREQQKKDSPSPAGSGRRLEPSLDDASPEAAIVEADTPESGPADEPVASVPQKIVTLRIVARRGSAFAGDELALSLRGIGMRHGKFGIFHRYEGSDESKIIFSAASLVEPGSFDLSNLKSQKIPGISLFMVLPGPIDGPQGFDLMMVAAKALAQSLKAELLDESGSTLSIQRERYLREEIIQFETATTVH